MPELPSWLASTLATQADGPPSVASPLLPAESFPVPGDLRPLVSMDVHGGVAGRIVLVMDVDLDARFVTVALTTNETDLATENDVLVTAELSNAPFDLLVELDLQATVRPCQLGRRLGHVQIDVLRDRDRTPSGIPVRSEDDDRVAFKNEELDLLYALAGEAMRAAEVPDDRILAVCDPDAIRQLVRADPSKLVQLVIEDAAALPGWVAEQLLLETSGHDEFVLLESLFQGSLETGTPYCSERTAVTAWHPVAERAEHELLEATISSVLAPDAGEVRVATIRSLWMNDGDAPSFVEVQSRRVQLDLLYVGAA